MAVKTIAKGNSMKTYKVTATYTVYCETEIQAENEDKAYEIACELDGGAFDPVENDGLSDWRIYNISEDEQ